MKVRRTKHDDIFSKVIRERDNHTCQRCNKSGGKLDCSHFFSRRHQATRYDPDNACAHCFTCHQYLGENPIVFQAWIKAYLGDAKYEMLSDRHNTIMKRTKADLEDLYQHYRGELKRLQELRANGEVGVLSVVGYD